MAIVKNSIKFSTGGGSEITVVANYSALPDPTTVSGEFYWCSASQGTSWLPGSLGGTFYNSGLYYSNGTTWEFLNVPFNATQAEVNTGTNNDKFVTPKTFTDASKWGTKADKHIFLRLISTNTLTSNTSAQNIFNIGYNGGAAGEIPLDVGLYDFEIKLYGTNFSATSGFISFNFGGTSVIDSILYFSYVSKASGVGVGVAVPITRAITTVSQITLTNTGTVCHGVLNGTIAISTAGTIIPQITMSQASASVIQSNTQITFSKKSDTYNSTN